jgi:hypothetical protein
LKGSRDTMAGKYTEFHRLPDGTLRITLLPEAREEVEALVDDQSLDGDTRLAEVIEW